MADRIQVARDHFFILNGNCKMLLKVADQIEDADRINHIAQQQTIVTQSFGVSRQKVLYYKTSNITLNIYRLH
ncbi:MAG: hypothetical protein WB421_13165 [Terriglobales bacterium]